MTETILIVDDEPDIVRALDYSLRREGFHTRLAYDGRTALQLAQGAPRPARVLLDPTLPDSAGGEVRRRLRAEAATRDLPVVMLTARGEELDRVLGFEAGADDYVVKPYSTRELVLRLRAVLRRGRSPSDDAAATLAPLEHGALRIDRRRPGRRGRRADAEAALLAEREARQRRRAAPRTRRRRCARHASAHRAGSHRPGRHPRHPTHRARPGPHRTRRHPRHPAHRAGSHRAGSHRAHRAGSHRAHRAGSHRAGSWHSAHRARSHRTRSHRARHPWHPAAHRAWPHRAWPAHVRARASDRSSDHAAAAHVRRGQDARLLRLPEHGAAVAAEAHVGGVLGPARRTRRRRQPRRRHRSLTWIAHRCRQRGAALQAEARTRRTVVTTLGATHRVLWIVDHRRPALKRARGFLCAQTC